MSSSPRAKTRKMPIFQKCFKVYVHGRAQSGALRNLSPHYVCDKRIGIQVWSTNIK